MTAAPASAAAGAVLHGVVGAGVFGLGEPSAARARLVCAASASVKEEVLVGVYPIVTFQYISPTSYHFICHI